MNEKTLNLVTIIGTTFIGLIFLSWWLLYNPVKDFAESVPGKDNRPEILSSQTEAVNIGAFFASFDGISSGIQENWPRFRGENFDNISRENIKLADSWGDSGPNILWSIDLGEGHAGPVISNGRVYVLDYDEEERADVLRCFSLDDSKEIWRRGYKLYVKRNHGMSRTVPAVSDKYVVTIGPKCHVMCVDAGSGNFRWGIDLEKEYGADVPLWYTGQCPLINDSLAVVAVGGKSLIIGVDCETGEVVWETPNPNNWKMSHSSVMPFSIHGKKMYVYCAIGGIVGISAEGETAGEIIFETNLFNKNVVAPSPIHLGDGRIFVTAGYGAGSMMLKLKLDGDSFSVESLQALKPGEGLASEQQTPIFYEGHLFSILPKDAGPLRNQFVCFHPDDCSKIVWSSGKTNRFGLGPYIVADGKFYILSDDGVITVLKASTKGYIQLAQAKVLDGVDAWGPLAIVKGRLLARDSHRLVCIDVRAQS
ncbi:MAG: PQQ-binding-like beta-propeller repeat protein [Candidatus Aminicenantes bacterium]|nr:PQQ-binding-like beta-propeller repeat protein [Candidatus Aminicenantes bacterium]